jgi:hypothetical protein
VAAANAPIAITRRSPAVRSLEIIVRSSSVLSRSGLQKHITLESMARRVPSGAASDGNERRCRLTHVISGVLRGGILQVGHA